jgi:hypothetical protein
MAMAQLRAIRIHYRRSMAHQISMAQWRKLHTPNG